MRALIDSSGGRKFILTIGAGITTTVLVWFAKITPEVYQWTILGTVAAYISGNAYQKVKTPPQ